MDCVKIVTNVCETGFIVDHDIYQKGFIAIHMKQTDSFSIPYRGPQLSC